MRMREKRKRLRVRPPLAFIFTTFSSSFISFLASLLFSISRYILPFSIPIYTTILFRVDLPLFLVSAEPIPIPSPNPEILSFGPNLLPNCAYQCKELYAAQYNCQDDVRCFCLSDQVKGLLEGSWACDGTCVTVEDRKAVNAWFGNLCKAYMGSSVSGTGANETPTDTSTTTSSTSTSTPLVGSDGDQTSRESQWWHKNWYWFLIVFLAIIIPIASYGLFFPIRKWYRRKLDQRRSGSYTSGAGSITLPPPSRSSRDRRHTQYQPRAPQPAPSPLPVPPPIPEGAFAHVDYANPHSPALTGRRTTRSGNNFAPGRREEEEWGGQGMMTMDGALRDPHDQPQQSPKIEELEEIENENSRKKGVWGRVRFWNKGNGGV